VALEDNAEEVVDLPLVNPCGREEIADAGFDWTNVRSDGVVLAELTPESGSGFLLARLWLRVRRSWRQLRHRRRIWRFWPDTEWGDVQER